MDKWKSIDWRLYKENHIKNVIVDRKIRSKDNLRRIPGGRQNIKEIYDNLINAEIQEKNKRQPKMIIKSKNLNQLQINNPDIIYVFLFLEKHVNNTKGSNPLNNIEYFLEPFRWFKTSINLQYDWTGGETYKIKDHLLNTSNNSFYENAISIKLNKKEFSTSIYDDEVIRERYEYKRIEDNFLKFFVVNNHDNVQLIYLSNTQDNTYEPRNHFYDGSGWPLLLSIKEKEEIHFVEHYLLNAKQFYYLGYELLKKYNFERNTDKLKHIIRSIYRYYFNKIVTTDFNDIKKNNIFLICGSIVHAIGIYFEKDTMYIFNSGDGMQYQGNKPLVKITGLFDVSKLIELYVFYFFTMIAKKEDNMQVLYEYIIKEFTDDGVFSYTPVDNETYKQETQIIGSCAFTSIENFIKFVFIKNEELIPVEEGKEAKKVGQTDLDKYFKILKFMNLYKLVNLATLFPTGSGKYLISEYEKKFIEMIYKYKDFDSNNYLKDPTISFNIKGDERKNCKLTGSVTSI